MSTIVVGYDGSPASRAAVEYAASRVGSEGKLVVVHTFPAPPGYIGQPTANERAGDAIRDADEVIAELRSGCDALAGIDWEPDLVAGDPAEAICRVAGVRNAEEIVIGSRGTGRVRSLLGSVAHDVLHRATAPVVVIPARAVEPAEGAATGQEA